MYIFQESFDEEEKLIDKLNVSNKYHLYKYLEKRIFNTVFLLYKSIRFIIIKNRRIFCRKKWGYVSNELSYSKVLWTLFTPGVYEFKAKIIFLENSSGLLHVQCNMSWRYFVFWLISDFLYHLKWEIPHKISLHNISTFDSRKRCAWYYESEVK